MSRMTGSEAPRQASSLALEDNLLDELEELEEGDIERLTDLDVHFGHHGWNDDGGWD